MSQLKKVFICFCVMALFRRLYNKVIAWSAHQYAPYYLAGVSFIESSLFPIPPDVMLIPMVMSKPFKAWTYAAITTIASLLGGILGYLLGWGAFEIIVKPMIQLFGYQTLYEELVNFFDHYGLLCVLLAGFTPIPYKLFTLGAGATMMPILPFLIGSLVSRGLRFFGVAWIIKVLGKKFEPLFLAYIDKIAWLLISVFTVGVAIYFWFRVI